jgi:carbon-monoxide dehydrogenase medium subunit
VFRARVIEDALNRRYAAEALDGLAYPAAGLNTDLHGSAEYRAHLITVLARRAVARAG